MVAGVVLAGIAIAIWLYALRPGWGPRAFIVLSQAANGRRLMLFALAGLLAALPADLQLTELWRRSVAEFLGIPLGTVKTRTRSALARLADVLGDEEL